MTFVTLAYKYVVIAVMMAEINYYAAKLQLQVKLPITDGDTVVQRAGEPSVITGFTGGIKTPEYQFGFSRGGKTRVIIKLEDGRWGSLGLYRGNLSTPDFMEKLSSIPSTIDTNGAYGLATNWVTAIGIDVEKMEKNEPLSIVQQTYQSPTRGLVLAPLFYIRWGDRGQDEHGHHIGPVVSVTVSGINQELLSLLIEDNNYTKRPFALIKDTDNLFAINDDEFLKYSDLERSNLLFRFSAVTYPVATNVVNGPLIQANNLATNTAPVKQ